MAASRGTWSVVALALMLPGLAGAVFLADLAARLATPPPAVQRSQDALMDAALTGTLTHALRLMQEGDDPVMPGPLVHGELTGGQEVTVTPLAIALALGDDNMVHMMLNHFVHPEDPRRAQARCLASRLKGGAATEAFADLLPLPDGGCPDLP
ncbi:MAG: hypothetical protein FJW23_12820 [Acidimicrobiia bacterium]|nr:hypothetical protein [Acidimicrobiia bacterium]